MYKIYDLDQEIATIDLVNGKLKLEGSETLSNGASIKSFISRLRQPSESIEDFYKSLPKRVQGRVRIVSED